MELNYIDLGFGVFWILGGVVSLCSPKLVWGYSQWSRERQDRFNIKGFSRLIGAIAVLSGLIYIGASLVGYGNSVMTVLIIIQLFVVLFTDKYFIKK